MLVHLLRRPDLLDPSLVHHHDAVGHLQGFLLIVGDEHAGARYLVVQPSQPPAQLLPHLGVERAERLVEQQHLRLHGQRAGQRNALPLAAGELGRIPVGQPVELHQRAAARGPWSRIRLLEGRRARGRTRRPKATFSNTVMCRNRA